MISKTPGEILKEIRLSKKISIAQISKGTHITARYIEALEKNNFSYFPAPTYVKGFLKTYGAYLGIEINVLTDAYKKLTIAEESPPLEELTKAIITWKNFTFIFFKWLFILSLLIASILLSIFTANHIFDNQNKKEDILYKIEKKDKSQDTPLQTLQTKTIQLKDGFSIKIFNLNSGINFIPDIRKPQDKIHLILQTITFSKKNPESFEKATFISYPFKKTITLLEDNILIIQNKMLPRVIYIKLLGYTSESIKVRLSQGRPNPNYEFKDIAASQQKEITTKQNSSSTKELNQNSMIDLKIQTLAPNFLEVYIDGQLHKKGIIPPNTYLTYRAEQTIQIKIGDAGTIRITVNGKQYGWGKQGQQVSKIIQKLKNPLKKGTFSIKIKDL